MSKARGAGADARAGGGQLYTPMLCLDPASRAELPLVPEALGKRRCLVIQSATQLTVWIGCSLLSQGQGSEAAEEERSVDDASKRRLSASQYDHAAVRSAIEFVKLLQQHEPAAAVCAVKVVHQGSEPAAFFQLCQR